MREEILAAAGILVVVAGTAFSVFGVLGYLRLPDVYTRLHATGKVSVFGVILFLAAGLLSSQIGVGRVSVLVLFLVIAGPVLSHSIGSAAYRIGIPMKGAVRDDLAARRKSRGDDPGAEEGAPR